MHSTQYQVTKVTSHSNNTRYFWTNRYRLQGLRTYISILMQVTRVTRESQSTHIILYYTCRLQGLQTKCKHYNIVLYYACRTYKGYKSSNIIIIFLYCKQHNILQYSYFCTNAGYKGYKPITSNTKCYVYIRPVARGVRQVRKNCPHK